MPEIYSSSANSSPDHPDHQSPDSSALLMTAWLGSPVTTLEISSLRPLDLHYIPRPTSPASVVLCRRPQEGSRLLHHPPLPTLTASRSLSRDPLFPLQIVVVSLLSRSFAFEPPVPACLPAYLPMCTCMCLPVNPPVSTCKVISIFYWSLNH